MGGVCGACVREQRCSEPTVSSTDRLGKRCESGGAELWLCDIGSLLRLPRCLLLRAHATRCVMPERRTRGGGWGGVWLEHNSIRNALQYTDDDGSSADVSDPRRLWLRR